MTEANKPESATFLRPRDQMVKLRLDDVSVDRKAGVVKVVVEADAASAPRAGKLLRKSLRHIEVKNKGRFGFILKAKVPSFILDTPDDSALRGLAIDIVLMLERTAKLDIGMECVSGVAMVGDKPMPAVTIRRSGNKGGNDDLLFTLASIMMERMDNSEALAELKLLNPKDGIETAEQKTDGSTDYVTCDLIEQQEQTSEQAAAIRSARLVIDVARCVGISDGSKGRSFTPALPPIKDPSH